MEKQNENILEKLILIDDRAQLMEGLIEDKSIEFSKVICCIMDHLTQIQNQGKIQYLAQFIGHTCLEKKRLVNIDRQINSMDDTEENSLKRIFVKHIVKEIGKKYFCYWRECTSMLFV